MFCQQCGNQIPAGGRFCPRCGREITGEHSPDRVSQPLPDYLFVRDRGSTILALGILSILLFGPFTGVPGWLMANQDLRDIRTGLLSATALGTVRTGKVLNILGTFCSLVSLLMLFIASIVIFSLVMAFGGMAVSIR